MAEDDAIVVDLDDIHHEALANMWSFSPDDDAASDLRPEDVAHFVGQVLEARRRRLVAEGYAAMLFYCWHDAQTRQLRFSLVSAAHGRLPFRIALQHEATPMAIAERIVHGDWCNPQWGQASDNDMADDAVPCLSVFVAQLP
ncbi:hypothetical protein [Comamonas terrigena]|uniref:hypothetical protein n=1 Tax=Comamonas terrigena TaxID=32013 RepID=UPI00289F8DBE|nr:hypothetical protein [Comamonas terrigena]